MRNVVVFCGGRGASSILNALARNQDIQVSAVVNAYDSGFSAGRVRRAIDGMLGPSDLRKNVSTLVKSQQGSVPVVALLEHRLSDGPASPGVAQQLRAVRNGQLDLLPDALFRIAVVVEHSAAAVIRDALGVFLKHVEERNVAGSDFDFSDLAIGNAVLGGLYLTYNDLDLAVARYSEIAGLMRHRVLNVTRGEDLWLSALSGGRLCPDEGTLVAGGLTEPISDLYLLPRASHDAVYGGDLEWMPASGVASAPSAAEELPLLSTAVRAFVTSADAIIYAPGTQHSSLYPSYLTVGLAEAIAMNVRAPKILMSNSGHDADEYQSEKLPDRLRKFEYFMTRRGKLNIGLPELVTDLAVTQSMAADLDYLPPGVFLHCGDWADAQGVHSGDLAIQLLDRLTVGYPKHAVRALADES